MKGNFFKVVILGTLFLVFFIERSVAQTATAPSGSGTEADPYLIESLANLKWLSQTSTVWDDSAYFRQTADIDASETSTWGSGKGFSPIGNLSISFEGIYDGGGHTISGLYINRAATSIGLFRKIKSSTIFGLGLVDASITGDIQVGGLVGRSDASTIYWCYVTGEVSGQTRIAGLAGMIYNSTVWSSYSVAAISGNSEVGGLVGRSVQNSSISDSYASGELSGDFNQNIGGVVGYSAESSSIAGSYWNTEVSDTTVGIGSQPDSATVKGLTSAQMRVKSNFPEFAFGTDWSIQGGKSFPYLKNAAPEILPGQKNLAFDSGVGTTAYPYRIATVQQLDSVRHYLNANFELINDIDMDVAPYNEGQGWIPIGSENNPFTGSFSGRGYKITNLYINRPAKVNLGLFRYMTNGSTISGVSLENVDITGAYAVGALVGHMYGSSKVERSYSTGKVVASHTAGGLVGRFTEYSSWLGGKSSPTINNSFSTVLVKASGDKAGGLVGSIPAGKIYSCYSSGLVYSGGVLSRKLIGSWNTLDTNISLSYRIGETGEYNGGNELTADKMREQSSFNNWNFNSVWEIKEGISFPYIRTHTPTKLPGIFDGGNGTKTYPYRISNASQVDSIRQHLEEHFLLNGDIDMDVPPYNSGEGWEPLGNINEPFTGSLKGAGYQISGLFIDTPDQDNRGLFGITQRSEIINLSMVDARVSGRDVLGVLVGSAIDSSSISQVVVKDIVVNGKNQIGGLTGSLVTGSTIAESYSHGQVRGSNKVGGFVGESDNSFVSDSYSNADVTGEDYVGGLIGETKESGVSSSYFFGTVQGNEGSYTGGLTGYSGMSSYVENSFWNTDSALVSTGEGNNPGTSTVKGLTSFEMMQDSSYPNWDFETIWDIKSGGTFPYLRWKTPDMLPGVSNFFDGGLGIASDPYLIATAAQLDKIRDLPYSVFELSNNLDLSTHPYNTGEGWEPVGKEDEPFTGVLNGKDYTITGLYINLPDSNNVGLFGVSSGARITNLRLEAVEISGNENTGGISGTASRGVHITDSYVNGTILGKDKVGGLAGILADSSSISNSRVAGQISGNNYVGGLTGVLNDSSGIYRSYSNGEIRGANYIGGITGGMYEASTTRNSYSSGKVIGNEYVGGFAGNVEHGEIENSFTRSKVEASQSDSVAAFIGYMGAGGAIVSSYWNPELSGQNISANGDSTGLIRAGIQDLKEENSFSGWDFSSDSTWGIVDKASFPYLKKISSEITFSTTFSGTEGWRTVGHTGDISYSELLSGIWTQGYEGSKGGIGTFSSNVYFFDETNYGWKVPDDANNYFGTASDTLSGLVRGALIWVYGDDNNDGIEDTWPKHLIFNSQIRAFDSTYVVPLSYSHPGAPDSSGWHLVSNPYPTSLSWRKIVTAQDNKNTLPVIYIWDHSVNDGNGGYRVNFGYPLPPGTPEDFFFDGDIPVMQSFWVKATDTEASLTFRPEYQSEAKQPYKMNSQSHRESPLWAGLLIESGVFSDQFLIFEDIHENMNLPKLGTLAQRFVEVAAIDESGQRWLSDSVSEDEEALIDLDINTTETGDFTFIWMPQERFPEGSEAFLLDRKTGEEISLTEGKRYSFTLVREETKETEEITPRFTLRLITRNLTSGEGETLIPETFAMDQNYPNPFNPSTVISYQVPENAIIDLRVFDVLGREVATLVSGQVEAGYHQVQFDAGNLASGMYIYRLQAGNNVFTKKLTLIK